MKTALKAMLALCLILIAGAVAAVGEANRNDKSIAAAVAGKDQTRVPSEPGPYVGQDYGTGLVELAQVSKSGHDQGEAARVTPVLVAFDGSPGPGGFGPQGMPPVPFGPPAPPPMPYARPLPPMLMPPTRIACEEEIDRQGALAGYIKSKLRLNDTQKEAWQKIEQAADPVLVKMQQLCASLPMIPDAAPNFPAMLDGAEKKTALRAELVHAIVAPAHALYEMLSPEQRAVLDRPPPPTR